MKHKHYDMIVAKAENMDLIVFSYCNLDRLWSEDVPRQPGVEFIDSSNTNYFLCLPQHKEACLHWLNGGEVQAIHFENQMPDSGVMFDSDFVDVEDGVDTYPWKGNHIFMQEHEIEIKPKKENRWIAYHKSGFLFDAVGKSESDIATTVKNHELSDYVDGDWSFHEIEVEV